jgi:hypothetical protein
MTFGKSLANSVVLMAILMVISAAPALALEHATVGILTHVDSAVKHIVVKTADGTEEVFRFTARTVVGGAKEAKKGTVASYFVGKEGTHVVVRFTGEGTVKTAVGIDDLGKGATKIGEGMVVGTDKVAHTVTVKTKDGGEETYHVASNATVDTDHGVVNGTEYVARNGEKVTVHYTEDAGKKVAHFIKHM